MFLVPSISGPFKWLARGSVAASHRALEMGVNWIDTAAVYGLGHSEEVVARALQEWQGPRPYVFTKCGMIWNGQGNVDYSLRQESIRRECAARLRRLNTVVMYLSQNQWTGGRLERDARRLDHARGLAKGRQGALDRPVQRQR